MISRHVAKKATVSPSEWRKICLGMYATLLRADRRNGIAGIANIRPIPFSRTACTLLSSSLPFSFSLSLVSLFRTIFKKADSFSIYYLALYTIHD